MSLKLTTRTERGILLITLDGRITTESIAALREAVRDQVAKGHSRVVIDMSDVTYMDSSGLGELVMAHGTITQTVCAECGSTVFRTDGGGWAKCPQCKSSERKPWGELKLVGVAGAVKDLFQFSHLHTVFHIYDSFEQAAGSFEQ